MSEPAACSGNCVKTPPRDTNKTSLNMETLPQFSILYSRCRGVFNVDTGLSRLSVNKSNHKCQLCVWQTKCSIQITKQIIQENCVIYRDILTHILFKCKSIPRSLFLEIPSREAKYIICSVNHIYTPPFCERPDSFPQSTKRKPIKY